jgi:hypothetical protein
MNLTVPDFGTAFGGVTTFVGVVGKPAQPELGRVAPEVEQDVAFELHELVEEEEGGIKLVWKAGPAGEVLDEQFSVVLRDIAPGVAFGQNDGWSVTVVAPKFVTVYGPDGHTWTFKGAADAGEKSWLQKYGSFIMIGVLFVANTVIRMWMGGNNGWAKKIATRDAAEAARTETASDKSSSDKKRK